MKPIKDLINKILWDEKENPEDYSLYYIDRIANEYKEIKFNEVKKLEGDFLVLEREEETEIPLHRIKFVKKKGVIVWERK